MNQTTASRPAAFCRRTAPEAVCVPIPVQSWESHGVSLSNLPLPDNAAQAAAALHSAPHLRALFPWAEHPAQQPLRLLLLCSDLQVARQGAAYLCSCRSADLPTGQEDSCEDDWLQLDNMLSKLDFEEEEDDDSDEENALSSERVLQLLTPSTLFPSLQEEGPFASNEQQTAAILRATGRSAVHVLFSAEAGDVLDEQLERFLPSCRGRDVFVALQPGQCRPTLLRRVCFEQGFSICRLEAPTEEYLKRQFCFLAAQRDLTLSPSLKFSAVLSHLRQLQGKRFSDLDLVRILDYARRTFGCARPLTIRQLTFPEAVQEQSGLSRLDALIGLDNVKTAVQQMIADAALSMRRTLAGIPEQSRCRNLTFSGEPGTCKSVTARILAQALRESGVGSGAFVEAGREQLVGRYLGQTSPQIAELFEKARDGVLFIDEAGALIDHGQDSYAREAVNAIVRHMELQPDTVVIFSTYPGEMDTLLGQNPGLSSRFARHLCFPPCTDDQLCGILAYLAGEFHYTLPQGWQELAIPMFAKLRALQGDRFGNGREARRFLMASIENLATRTFREESASLEQLTLEDLSAAGDTLLREGRKKSAHLIGF